MSVGGGSERGDNVDVTSLPPIVVGGDMDTKGTQRACGCASPEVTMPDQNHTVSLSLLSGFLCTRWLASATRQPSPLPLTKRPR